MSSELFKNYFDMPMNRLRLTGLFFKYYMKSKYRLYWIIHCPIAISCGLYLTYEEIRLIANSSTLNEVVKNLRDHLNHVAGTIKLIAFVIMRQQFYDIMRTLQTYNFNYEDCDDFNCKLIVKKQLKTCHRWINAFYTLIYCIVLSIWLGENFRILTTSYTAEMSTQIISLNLGLIGLTSLGWITLGFDVVFTTMCSCLTAHILIVQGAFKTIRQRCLIRMNTKESNNLYDSDYLQNETTNEMKKCISHLQTIINVCDSVEYVYNKQALFQTSISLLEICFCLYLSSTRDKDVAMNVFYLMATMFQLMLYCWHGNELTYASSGIPYAVYEGDWFSSDTQYKKLMIITMSRMNRPLNVTIGKITPMSFSTFLTIMRASYSVFTFLKQKENMSQFN